MPYRTTITGKISKLRKIEYKGREGEARVAVEFTVAEPTGRKHPEGHPYAGKSVMEWTNCKSFTDRQAEMILGRFKDGEYITIDGELRYSPYDRDNVEVLVPRSGQEPLKVKGTINNWPALEFHIDRVHFVTDAPENYNSDPVIEESTLSELEVLAAAQLAEAQAKAAGATAGNEVAAGAAAGEKKALPF